MSWLIRSPYPDGNGDHRFIVGVSSVYFSAETSKEIALPSGWQTGDLLVLEVWHWGASGSTSAQTISTSGWNYSISSGFLRSAGTAWGYIQSRHKLAAADETNPTITLPTSLYGVAFLTAYRSSQPLAVRNSNLLRDISSPYVTGSLDTTTPAALSIFAGASRASTGSTYNPGTISINGDSHLIKHVSSGGSGRGALTHIDVTSTTTYGPYTNTWSNTVGETFGVLQEISEYDKTSTIPTYIGSSADLGWSLDNQLDISAVGSSQSGDLLILFLCTRGVSQSAAESYGITGDWDLVATSFNSFSNAFIRIYKKTATGSGNGALLTWSPGYGGNKTAMIVAYRNATTVSNPIPYIDQNLPMEVPGAYMKSRGILGIFTNAYQGVSTPIGLLTLSPAADNQAQYFEDTGTGNASATVWFAGINVNQPARYPLQQNGSSANWSCTYPDAPTNQTGFTFEIT